MKSLTIVYVTNRDNPNSQWFFDSLCSQSDSNHIRVILVDGQFEQHGQFGRKTDHLGWGGIKWAETVSCKPTVWSGPSRLTKQDWWSASNARNTGICLCQTDWICFLDDRSVLLPGWLDCIKQAMSGNYIMCGTYEKRTGMKVENGVITHGGIVTGVDVRLDYCDKNYTPKGMAAPFNAPGEWTFGCCVALPLEWALSVNGFDETCDGLGAEDTIFGLQLANHGYPCKFDPRCKIVEDRTPGETFPVYRREDFGVSPNDYSHQVLGSLKVRKTAAHPFDIRALRKDILSGKEWPKPWGPCTHPWDNRPLSEL